MTDPKAPKKAAPKKAAKVETTEAGEAPKKKVSKRVAAPEDAKAVLEAKPKAAAKKKTDAPSAVATAAAAEEKKPVLKKPRAKTAEPVAAAPSDPVRRTGATAGADSKPGRPLAGAAPAAPSAPKPVAPAPARPTAPVSKPAVAPVPAAKAAPAAGQKPAPAAPRAPAPAAPKAPAPAAPKAPASAPAPLAKAPAAPPPPPAAPPRGKIQINELLTVKELAEKMNAKLPDVMKKFISFGKVLHINQRVGEDLAKRVADSFGFDVESVPLYAEEAATTVTEDVAQLQPRPPVVTVMGHVDHGKTSLLDAIRETRVAEKEAGGITQHIGAYQVTTEKGAAIAFLDTPGHEAFTAMRARGAQATDLVVLVVGADDGVMPQTLEALDHARAAGVPIVVAINKVDLPTANPQKVKQELSNHGLIPEDWGGKTVMVEVSAKTRKNLDTLLEMILLEAELLDLKANPNRAAQAVVVEAKLDTKRGPVATVLVQKGTLRVGDAFVCGATAGKVRALLDHKGHRVKDAPPSCPVEILGLSGTPQAGDKLVVVANEREAREIAERRQGIAAGEGKAMRHHLTLEALHEEAAAGKVKGLPIVLKADVQGSMEPIRDSLEKLSTPEITLRVIHAGIGGINNSDVILAAASDAVILGFNVRPDPSTEEMARREGVEIKTYRIIYDLVNDVKAALEGLLAPLETEVTQGWVEVRQIFRTPKVGTVAGCYVTDGKISRGAKVRLVRNGTIVFDGSIAGLRRFKDDVREVEKGYECGLSLENYQDIKPGDRIEFYVLEKKARKLS